MAIGIAKRSSNRVGGIVANSTYPADFIRDNLEVQTNLIHQLEK